MKQIQLNFLFFYYNLKYKQQNCIDIVTYSVRMQNRQRFINTKLSLSISKLLQYDYFCQIFRKYDSNFLREIIPYFVSIVTTTKLDLLKFIYIPIHNPFKVKGLSIGQPCDENKHLIIKNICELQNQVTFVKVTYQAHLILEYLIKLDFSSLGYTNVKFQQKFWLFSQAKLNIYKFNEVVYKRQSKTIRQPLKSTKQILKSSKQILKPSNQALKSSKQALKSSKQALKSSKQAITQTLKSSKQIVKNINQKGIYILLEGQFRFTFLNKPNINILGKGYLIDSYGYLKRIKFLDKTKLNNQSIKQNIIENYIQKQAQDQQVYEVISNSNNSKILFIEPEKIHKYLQEQKKHLVKQSKMTQKQTSKISNSKVQDVSNTNMVKAHLKYHRINNDKNEQLPKIMSFMRKTSMQQISPIRNDQKYKFSKSLIQPVQKSLIKSIQRPSHQSKTNQCHQLASINKRIQESISEIAHNQIVRSYTKQSQVYVQMKRSMQKFKLDKLNSIQGQNNQKKLLSFFKNQLQQVRQKSKIKKQKAKQSLQVGFLMNQTVKQNKENKGDIIIRKCLSKKVSKTQVRTFNLLQRNQYNKKYHCTQKQPYYI